MKQTAQNQCPDCGGSLSFEEYTQDATRGDHHNNVYVCGDCGRRVVSG